MKSIIVDLFEEKKNLEIKKSEKDSQILLICELEFFYQITNLASNLLTLCYGRFFRPLIYLY